MQKSWTGTDVKCRKLQTCVKLLTNSSGTLTSSSSHHSLAELTESLARPVICCLLHTSAPYAYLKCKWQNAPTGSVWQLYEQRAVSWCLCKSHRAGHHPHCPSHSQKTRHCSAPCRLASVCIFCYVEATRCSVSRAGVFGEHLALPDGAVHHLSRTSASTYDSSLRP